MKLKFYVILLAAQLNAFSIGFCASEKLCEIISDFNCPPPDAKAETWWHFTTNAITREGITADLEAMKQIGYGGAHIFALVNQAKADIPKIEILDDNWRALMRHAGKEAKRLGLRLGVHNCPGWSSSGGPWIKPEDSMKHVVVSEARVAGPFSGKLVLPQPKTFENFYRDIAVLAVPCGEAMPLPKVSANFPSPQNVLDASAPPCVLRLKEKGAKETLVFEFEKPFKAATAEFVFDDARLYVHADVYVSDDGSSYRLAGTFDASLHNDLRTPKFAALESAVGRFFKFEFSTSKFFHEWEKPRDLNLKRVRLLSERFIPNLDQKCSLSQKIGFVPPKPSDAGRAGVDPASVLDLSGAFAEGEGSVALPAGNWAILRVGYTSTGAKNAPTQFNGLECDKLSKRGLEAHWPHYMQKMLDDLGAPMLYATIDSYEVGGQNWTQDFPAEFKKRRGYDIIPWLPALAGFIVGNESDTSKFLYDIQRTVSDLMAENYYDYFAELCRKNGLVSIVEPYGGMFDSLRCVRNVEIPAGEFWIGRGNPPARMTASSAHLFGKRMAATESFTTLAKSGRWLQTPAQLKEYGDRAWIHGISKIIVHTYVHQPFMIEGPGMTLGPAGTHMTRLNTWWKFGDAWVSYLNRSQALLQRGAANASVLWLSGESKPNLAWYVVRDEITKAGYDYDYCSSDDVAEMLKLEGGKIFASKNGTRYALLALGDDRYLSVRTLSAVKRLLEEGAIVAGMPPIDTPTLGDDPGKFAELVRELWGKGEKIRKIGKGTLYATPSVPEALKLAKIPPEFSAPDGVRVIRRTDGDAEICFAANLTDVAVSGEFSFCVGDGKSPFIFDPYSGSVSEAAVFNCENGTARLSMALGARESKFIVFAPGRGKSAIKSLSVYDDSGLGGFEVVEAFYRSKTSPKALNVLKFVKSANGSPLKVKNSAFATSLAPGEKKELFVKYKLDGKLCETIVDEGGTFAPLAGKSAAVRAEMADGKPVLRFYRRASAAVLTEDGKKTVVSDNSLPHPKTLEGPWSVSFQPGRGAPEKADFPSLYSWTESENDGIRYFSGIAEYGKEFRIDGEMLKKGRRIILSLGRVADVARVSLNGREVATLWMPPFECDITDFIKPGSNSLSISVANRWCNRLIGDARISKSPDAMWPQWLVQKRPNDTDRIAYTSLKGVWKSDDVPLESGLIGPVQLKCVDFLEIFKNNDFKR